MAGKRETTRSHNRGSADGRVDGARDVPVEQNPQSWLSTEGRPALRGQWRFPLAASAEASEARSQVEPGIVSTPQAQGSSTVQGAFGRADAALDLIRKKFCSAPQTLDLLILNGVRKIIDHVIGYIVQMIYYG
jgi:hypothetical protein